MTQSAAERQKAYRARRAHDHRLNLYIAADAGAALARLGRAFRLTQRQMLERLLLTAEHEHLQELAPGSPELLDYLGQLEYQEPEL